MRSRTLLIVFWLALVAHGTQAGEGEWTRFRGPNGTGISNAATIPVKWTEKDYNWKVKLPGVGYSSPVIWGDKVFLTCADKNTARRTIICLGTSDGGTVWRKDYKSTPYRHHRDNSFAASTPAIDADGVYASWTTPKEVALLALDHSGKQKWRRNLGPFKSRHGSGTSPIVYNDLVILANDQMNESFLIAVDRETGETRWKLERPTTQATYSTPCIYRPAGSRPEVVFTSSGAGIVSVSPEAGTVNWEVSGIFPKRCACSPVFAPGIIFGSCGQGGRGVQTVAVRPGSKEKNVEPKVAYTLGKPSAVYVPTPLVKGDLIFLWSDARTVTCLRVWTGEEVWSEEVGGSYYGSPVCVNDRLYCISKKGEVVVIAASEKFELLAKNPLGEKSYATPAVAGGRMYLRTYTHLISIGGK